MAKHFLPLIMAVAVAVAAILVTATADDLAPAPTMDPGNSTAKPTAYEMLERYGFPPGILPAGAVSYDLGLDGSFQVNFPSDCSFRVSKQYKVNYSSRVAGNIQNGSISGLEGVKVKILFAWINIREVDLDGGELRMHAGSVSKSFSLDHFSTSPQCN
ncbi:uncharacterized protein [Lolium perenne]|uniref:uncharacterized protein n=1 Tax=Lolium perenne TaxID=4522 RepID=UPI003A99AED4